MKSFCFSHFRAFRFQKFLLSINGGRQYLKVVHSPHILKCISLATSYLFSYKYILFKRYPHIAESLLINSATSLNPFWIITKFKEYLWNLWFFKDCLETHFACGSYCVVHRLWTIFSVKFRLHLIFLMHITVLLSLS